MDTQYGKYVVNDFYAALLNTVARNSEPGADFVPQQWVPRKQSSAAEAIRQALLLRPRSAVAANWRAIEIRRLFDRCDLASLRTRFDPRDAYALTELQSELTQYLRPSVISDNGRKDFKLLGKLRSEAYQIRRWQVTVGDTEFTITSENTTVNTMITDTTATVMLPSSAVKASFSLSTTGSYFVTWAANPLTSIAATSEILRNSLRGTISGLANEHSILDQQDITQLRNVVLYDGEAAPQVVAAAILLAGNTLASEPLKPAIT